MIDACQNRWAQEIEREYLRCLGVCETVIEHYYSFRAGYNIKADCAGGKAGTQKTSGETGTLMTNGIVSKIISNWLVRGEGLC